MKNCPQYNAILCRYDEIALKKGNRTVFESLFVQNLRRVLAKINPFFILQERGRILIQNGEQNSISDDQLTYIFDQLPHVFGLSSFSPGWLVNSQLDQIEKIIQTSFEHRYQQLLSHLKNGHRIAYRMRARRSDKNFPLTSSELEIYFADKFLSKYPKLFLDLKKADLHVGVEIRKSWSFIFYERILGPGGLPSGSNGQALSLLSGGIDSPVSSYLAMKRGCHVMFLTFHSFPYTPEESLDKVKRIVQILNRYQREGKLLACNLSSAQKIIRDQCTERFRTVLYRRLMMRIASKIAQTFRIHALITGESIGQVASQTLHNLDTINNAATQVILRPLTGMDKLEITQNAKKIGTLSISQENAPDSCTVFAPRSPSTGASIDRILLEEKRLDINSLVESLLINIKCLDSSSQNQQELSSIISSKE